MTARKTESPIVLLRDAAGPRRTWRGKGARLARILRGYGRSRELDARLERLAKAGVIETIPTRVQLAIGAWDMLRFWISPAAADYYAKQDIHYGFHQLLRFLDEPASLADPIGLFSTEDGIVGHLMQVVHANPVYDLQLLCMWGDGLDVLEAQLEAMQRGTHPAVASRSEHPSAPSQQRRRALLGSRAHVRHDDRRVPLFCDDAQDDRRRARPCTRGPSIREDGMKRIFAVATLSLACGASPATVGSPQTLPSASGGTALGDPRSCDGLGALISSPRAEPVLPVAVARQMTEQAARAKRLFDAERWAEAERALAPVARGDSGDDAGNSQLAQYHLAIAIYRQKDFRRSYAIFSEMARNRSHIKHSETLLWLAKFVTDYGDLVDFADFGNYTPEDAARFDNPNQREVFSAASFALGRERLQEGARAEAQALFSHVDPDGPLGALATRCRERAR